MKFHERIKNKLLLSVLSVALAAFIAFMVIGRLLSGVHWFTDIIGGAFLRAGLVTLYAAVCHDKGKDLLL